MRAEQNNAQQLTSKLLAKIQVASERRQLADKAERERKTAKRTEELRREWNAPEINVRCWPNESGPWGENLKMLKDRIGKGVIIGIVGGEGTGKTQMAVECMRHVTTELRSARYETATGIALTLKATFGGNGSELDELRKLAKPALLVIDEIDKMKQSGWATATFFHLLSMRHNSLRDTIVMGNCQADELRQTLTDYGLARMKQGGGIIECTWPSFRTGW